MKVFTYSQTMKEMDKHIYNLDPTFIDVLIRPAISVVLLTVDREEETVFNNRLAESIIWHIV